METEHKGLQGFQRKHLRSLAHSMKPVVHVGEKGVTDAVVEETSRALLDHELIKVRLHEPEDKKGMTAELAARTGADVCGLVGHTVVLYKRHPEEPKIKVPSRAT